MGRPRTCVIGVIWHGDESFVVVPVGAQAKAVVAIFTEEHRIEHSEYYALFTVGEVRLEDYEHVQPAALLKLHERRPA